MISVSLAANMHIDQNSNFKDSSRNFNQEQIIQIYSAINYNSIASLEAGPLKLADLSEREQEIYIKLLPKQDQRGDPGHVNTVLYFTKALGSIISLNSREQEAVNLAAIFHDVGWFSVRNIQQIWNQLATQIHSKDEVVVQHAKQQMADLRKVHELEASRLARQLLSDHPMLTEICAAVEDHDTREKTPHPIFRVFYDADWLWRATLFSRMASSSGNYDINNSDQVFAGLNAGFRPNSFLLPWSYFIHRIELTNTMLTLAIKNNWQELPVEFMDSYKVEIESLKKRAK